MTRHLKIGHLGGGEPMVKPTPKVGFLFFAPKQY